MDNVEGSYQLIMPAYLCFHRWPANMGLLADCHLPDDEVQELPHNGVCQRAQSLISQLQGQRQSFEQLTL